MKLNERRQLARVGEDSIKRYERRQAARAIAVSKVRVEAEVRAAATEAMAAAAEAMAAEAEVRAKVMAAELRRQQCNKNKQKRRTAAAEARRAAAPEVMAAEAEVRGKIMAAELRRQQYNENKQERRARVVRERRYIASAVICRHCGQEGHDPIALSSCQFYCRYCRKVGHSVQACTTRVEDNTNNDATNKDASEYEVSTPLTRTDRWTILTSCDFKYIAAQRAVQETMVFFPCGVCDREYGLKTLVDIESVRSRVELSGIRVLYKKLLAPLQDEAATTSQKAYAAAVHSELIDGIRKGSHHVCAQCCKQLPEEGCDAVLAATMVPTLALVNGYFRGACPVELHQLTLVERSLISLINVVTPLAMLELGTHYRSSATVFSVLNDVAEVAKQLPRSTAVGAIATIIRPQSGQTPRPLRYNPRRVLSALAWLKENNDLYAGIDIEPPETNGGEWQNGGEDSDLELPYIRSEPEDYEGIAEADLESPAGADGHPVNPGAPDSSTSDVYLYNHQTHDTRQQLAAIAHPSTPPGVLLVRTNGTYTADYLTPRFLQMAFPHLYPYGQGGPGASAGVEFDHQYITNMLMLGNCRSFQQCPRFIFYSYTWVMRKRVGTISFLAGKTGRPDIDDLTVAQAREMLADLGQSGDPYSGGGLSKAKLWWLVSKLQPYAQCVPGTELFFGQERRKLLSMISSPVTTTAGQWTWFYTEAQPDNYLPEIYDNAVTSYASTRLSTQHLSLAERRVRCDALTKSERAEMLRAHPFMSARIHALQLDAFWTHVLCGKRKPLGEIADYWMRVEFQMKGTPHLHSLINISKASMPGVTETSVTSDDAAERAPVQDLVSCVATARLLNRVRGDESELYKDATLPYRLEQEKMWSYNIDRPRYFADSDAPGRQRFTASVDYSMNSATGEFADRTVHQLYRRLQLANQMHKCRSSCWKYCRAGRKVCRYGFTREEVPGNDVASVIVQDRDRRGRMRTRVLPPRNNGNINNHLRNPLCFIAGRGNQDIQYIQNTTGGAEYCSKYCSKAEAAESTALQNAVNRRLAKYILSLSESDRIPLQWQLRAVGNAVIGAQQVGTVQACYMLGKLPLVKSSRRVEFVNCIMRSELTMFNIITAEEELNELEEEASALSRSPSTQQGKRDAFYELWKQQMAAYGEVNINYFAFLSSYSLQRITNKSSAAKVPSGCKLLRLDEHGFIIKPVTFKIGQVKYTARRRTAVLCLSPKLPIDEENERSAFSILLLYSNWGTGGEASLSQPTAVQRLQLVRGLLPDHVQRSLQRIRRSEALLANAGDPNIDRDMDHDATVEHHVDDFEDACDAQLAATTTATITSLGDLERVTTRAPMNDVAFLHGFLQYMKDTHAASREAMTPEEKALKDADPDHFIPISTAGEKEERLQRDLQQMNTEQRWAYTKAIQHVSGQCAEQMIMFLSGEGGTGKSKVIGSICTYTQLLYGKTAGSWGAVLKTGPTGNAAHNIGGSTWHSALCKASIQGRGSSTIAETTVSTLQRKAQGTVLFVIDELSMVSCEDLYEISSRLGVATGKPTIPFGGLHTLLVGDFYQMKPVVGASLVSNTIPETKLEATRGRSIMQNSLTAFCMLKVNVRAMAVDGTPDPLAHFCTHVRIGDVSNGIVQTMNDRVVNTREVAMRRASPVALWITSTHQKARTINKEFKQRRLDNGERMFTIIARHAPSKTRGRILTAEVRRRLYCETGDPTGNRNALMLSHMDLFIGSRVRLIRNLFVEGGLYNGAMATVWGFVFRGDGPKPSDIVGDNRLYGDMEDYEREIPIVLVQMDGDEQSFPYSCSTEIPRLVPITEVQSAGLVCGDYIRFQLPILPAEARTAHSVQGLTAVNDIVVEPGSTFYAGDYTAVSRGRAKNKVLLLAPLQDHFFTNPAHVEYRAAIAAEYQRLETSAISATYSGTVGD